MCIFRELRIIQHNVLFSVKNKKKAAMKKITTLFTVFYCIITNALTPITDTYFDTTLNTYLHANPVDEMRSDRNKLIVDTLPNAALNISDPGLTNISIYPNPVVDKLFIEGLLRETKVSIYNVLGKLVVSKTTLKSIDVDHLQSGIYIVKIVDGKQETVKKFIKK
jgi:hypothetical protein